MGEPVTPLLTFVFCFLGFISLCKWYIWRKKKMSVLERNRIPGPKPNLISGNSHEYEAMSNVPWDSHLIETYGRICGYYLGAKPIVLVADPNLLRKIQREDQRKFLERPRRVPGGINPDPLRAKMLGNLPVSQWNKLRKTISPTFNSLSLKEMTKPVIVLVGKMIASIPVGSEVELYEKFKCLTLDIIGKTAFGLDTNILGNPNDPFLKAVAAEFTKSTSDLLVRSCLYFPEVASVIRRVRIGIQNIWNRMGWCESSPLWNQGRMALVHRNQTDQRRHDLLQHLLDAELESDDIVANSVLFFEAAYETLSSCLAFTVHLIVNHANVQDEIQEELHNYLEEFDGFDHRIVDGLPYMDRVIKESLRLYPPQTTFIGRASEEDYIYKNSDGVEICTIPKGTHIQVALYQIHRDPLYWTEPQTFNPDRFLDTDLAKADFYQPFGLGRRSCIGKGFANLVLKMVLAQLFTRFTFQPSENTETFGNVKIHYKTATMTPRGGCWAEATPAAA